MTRRAFVVLLLLSASAIAQTDPTQRIDMSSGFSASNSPTGGVAAKRGYVSAPRVTVSDLSIPARARKEFEKANESLRKQDFTHALRDLNKAVSICPQFADAYNNLGVAYERLGDTTRERAALEKAIEINDHLALAYRNLGRMDLLAADFSGGEVEMQKASALDPNDSVAVTLLAYAQLMQGHLDKALATSQQAHALRAPHALAHRVAARVYELRHQTGPAVSELTLLLKEEPSGLLADSARKELEIVQISLHLAGSSNQ